MQGALDNLERFLHEADGIPTLIQCGLVHAQFETIHPFLHGNGRVGRLLITFLLCHRAVLLRPLLYLSHILKRHRAEYYDRLMAIRLAGDWEGWLQFFLRGVWETADEATTIAREIVRLREQHRILVQEQGLGPHGPRLLDFLFEHPLMNINLIRERLGIAYSTANHLVDRCEEVGLLQETTGGSRNRRYRYTPYLALFADEGPPVSDSRPIQMTGSEP